MGRAKRVDVGGYVYHALNRGNGRMTLFEKRGDYEAFERVIEQAVERFPSLELLAYCVMPNHWHFVVRTARNGQLSSFFAWVTLTHTQRWHAHRHTSGGGHVYQGRFKSFLVEDDRHFATVCRYVERNPLRSGLVRQAQDWRWSSLWRWHAGSDRERAILKAWPTPSGRRPRRWVATVNKPQSAEEEEALHRAISRGQPFGSPSWQEKMIKQFELQSTCRNPGRPKQKTS